MTKHTAKPQETAPVDQPVVAASVADSFDHQENSPAIDLSDPAVTAKAVNTVAVAKADVAAFKAEVISQDEYDRRTKLDVSNPEYINKSLDTVKVK